MRRIRTTTALEQAFEQVDNSEALRLLSEGYPIVYREPETPAGHVIQRYPDGRRELVSYENGELVVVGELSPVSPELKPAKYDPRDLISCDDD
ncbi:hypothetical protein [Brucella sp.]|uniref:hypothetical protein n=1 Tax=Brucella sp. TaxID=52132 RepID=UPI0028AC591B|nr:hypothetical protein [Brucella sp.]